MSATITVDDIRALLDLCETPIRALLDLCETQSVAPGDDDAIDSVRRQIKFLTTLLQVHTKLVEAQQDLLRALGVAP